MSAVEDILSMIDIDQLASKLGTDPATAKSAVSAAIPTLIGGLQANANSAAGEQSLLGALADHATRSTADLDQIDTADGQKIVQHMLADDPQRLAGVSKVGGDLLSKLLPILAPIVMNYLGQRLLGGASSEKSGGIGDILGGLLGGEQTGNAIGDILGSVLGGQSSGGGLADILGGLLGGSAPAKKTTTKKTTTTRKTSTAKKTTAKKTPANEVGDLLGGLLGQILGK